MTRRSSLRVLAAVGQAAAVLLIAGCSTIPPPPPPEPRVTVPLPPPPGPPSAPTNTLRALEARSGQLVKFGKLRTVVIGQETVAGPDGATAAASEIKPLLERELVRRDFRLFSDAVPAATDLAALSRAVKAHLVVRVEARSAFVNTTGRFARYRATADAQAVRGRDGTLLATARLEADGPREQDSARAGLLALRAAGAKVSAGLLDDLFAKTDQLLWAGLIVNSVPTMDAAVAIQNELERRAYINYVDLLQWDRESETASYEIIYGLKHESDIGQLLADLPGIRLRLSTYEPGAMDALQRILTHYK